MTRRHGTRPKFGEQLGSNSYQTAILSEFLAAVILVAATPFASSKNPDTVSPYEGSDVLKLTALTMVYLILALISSASRGAGRFAALFGLLVLLTVGLNEAANLVAAFDLFAGVPGTIPGTGPGSGGKKK